MRRVAFVHTFVTDEPALYEISLTLCSGYEQIVGPVAGVDFAAQMHKGGVCGALSWAHVASPVGETPWRSPNA